MKGDIHVFTTERDGADPHKRPDHLLLLPLAADRAPPPGGRVGRVRRGTSGRGDPARPAAIVLVVDPENPGNCCISTTTSETAVPERGGGCSTLKSRGVARP